MKKLFVVFVLLCAVFVLSVPQVSADNCQYLCAYGSYLITHVPDPSHCPTQYSTVTLIPICPGINPAKIYTEVCASTNVCQCKDPANDLLISGGGFCETGFLYADEPCVPGNGTGCSNGWYAACSSTPTGGGVATYIAIACATP